MPQLLVLLAAGAGLYSAYKWVSREAERAGEAARQAQDTLRRKAEAARTGAPRDLGELVWDEAAGAYRPKRGA